MSRRRWLANIVCIIVHKEKIHGSFGFLHATRRFLCPPRTVSRVERDAAAVFRDFRAVDRYLAREKESILHVVRARALTFVTGVDESPGSTRH